MKKKLLIVCVMIIGLVVMGVILFLIFNNRNELYPVIDTYNTNYKEASVVTSKLIMISDGEKIGFIDYNNKSVVDLKYDYKENSILGYHNEYVVISNNSKKILLDNDGKEVLNNYDDIILYNNHIVTDNNGIKTVYDIKLNKIISSKRGYNCEILDKAIIFYDDNNTLIYDMDGKSIATGDTYFYGGNSFIVIGKNEKLAIYYTNNKKLTDYSYDAYSSNKNKILLLENDTYNLFDENGKLIKKYSTNLKDLELVNQNLISRYDCSINEEDRYRELDMYGRIYDLDGKQITDTCSDIYPLEDNSFLAIKYNKVSYYKHNELIKTFDNYNSGYSVDDKYFQLNYYKNDTDEYRSDVYDYNGNKIYDNISFLSKDKKLYQLNLKNGFIYLLNEKNKYVSDIPFIYGYITDDLVIYQNIHGKYGLLSKDGKKLVVEKYNNCDGKKNIALCDYNGHIELNKVTYLKKKDKDKYKNAIVSYSNAKIDIDVDKVIKEYKLSDMKNIINSNKDYFIEYAYAVINNNNLGKYKDRVLNLFKIVMEMKNYLDLDTLVQNISQLSIKYYKNKPAEMVDYAAGQYFDSDLSILMIDDSDRVIYHELIHFLQYNKDRNNNISGTYIYKCDDKYYDVQEVLKLSNDNIKKCSRTILGYQQQIEEASAEENSTEFFVSGIPITYFKQVQIYELFEYLFGTDKMNEISFSSSRNPKLFLEFNKYLKWNITEFQEFSEMLNNIYNIDIATDYDEEMEYHLYKICDTLIDLYKVIKGDKWKSDELFILALKTILFDETTSNLLKNELDNYLDQNDLTIKYINDYNNIVIKTEPDIEDSYSSISWCNVIINSKHKNFNNKNAVVCPVVDTNYYSGNYYIYYDNDKIVDHKYVKSY